VIQVNPAKFKKLNVAGAKAFADFMVAKDTQALIGKFGVEKYGSPCFSRMPEERGIPGQKNKPWT